MIVQAPSGTDDGSTGPPPPSGADQTPVRPAVVRDVLSSMSSVRLKSTRGSSVAPNGWPAVGEALPHYRRLHLPHRDVPAERQHDDLRAGQIRFVLAARYARVGDADRDFRAADVVPVRVARDRRVIDGLEAGAEVVLDPEVEVGMIAAARIEDRGLEAAVRIGRHDRDFVAAEPPPPPGPQAEPRDDQPPVVGECLTHDQRGRAAELRMDLGFERVKREPQAWIARRQRLRVEGDEPARRQAAGD